ncbi:unnamed protein product [Lymnaea stagnalis]|uniref:Uncharacterized protein n=1 Tax=Lymnaea stagnalis TaxID=6523 RepID=A0AAV2HSB9_LYMST
MELELFQQCKKFARILRCKAFVIFCLVLMQAVLASGTIMKRSSDKVTGEPSVESSNITITANTTEKGGEGSSKANTGAVVAASVIAVVVCIVVVFGVYIFKRRRQSLMMDKEKKMQIQMSSARNAGVYQDLTVSVPAEDKPPASPEHERLKAAEDA